jgi:hypothetical protein
MQRSGSAFGVEGTPRNPGMWQTTENRRVKNVVEVDNRWNSQAIALLFGSRRRLPNNGRLEWATSTTAREAHCAQALSI